MRDKYFNVAWLVRIQRLSWYLVTAFFAALAIMYLLDFQDVFRYTRYGIVLILATAVAQLVVMAEQFRMAGLWRFWALSYALVLILGSVALVRYLF